MSYSTRHICHYATDRGWRKEVRLAALFTLLLSALISIPSAAENAYHLVGTVESKNFTGAVIITSDGKQSFYHLRETLPDGAQLVRVDADSILLKGSDGSRYEMFITASANSAGTAVSSPNTAMSSPNTTMSSPNIPSSVPRESIPNSAKKLRSKGGRAITPD